MNAQRCFYAKRDDEYFTRLAEEIIMLDDCIAHNHPPAMHF